MGEMHDLRVEARRGDDPAVIALIAALQEEYVQRYGGPDLTPVQPGEFDPPEGIFLVGVSGQQPVASGAWRRVAADTVEIKRLYVQPDARGLGWARRIMADLETSAARSGYRRAILMTGTAQPEAMSLYDSIGYATIGGYGYYADAPDARFYGKDLIG